MATLHGTPHAAPVRTLRTCLLAPALLFVLLVMTTRSALAAPPDLPPCDPSHTTTSRCLVVQPLLTAQLSLRATSDGLIFAAANAPGNPQLRVLDTASLAVRGVVSLPDSPFLYQAGYIYTTASPTLSSTTTAELVLHVGAPERPAPVGSFTLAAPSVSDWAISPAALFVLVGAGVSMDNAAQSVPPYDLQVYALDNPAAPQRVATLPMRTATRLLAHADMLYAAGPDGLALIDGADPRHADVVAETAWPGRITLDNVDLAAVGDYLYAMGTVAPSGSAFCTTFDVRRRTQPVAMGACPFTAGKSTFSRGFAYVNPNLSPAEYLDYLIYALADPAAPTRVGVTPQRWRAAFALPDGLVIQTADGRIARLMQSTEGALTTAVRTWSADELEVDGAVRSVTGDMAIVDRGATSPDGGRILRFVDISQRFAPEPRGTLSSTWVGAQHLELEGTQLRALHRNRLTFFETRDPAHAEQVGQFVSPLGDTLEHMVPAGPQTTFLMSEHNTLLAVDSRTPTTPTLAAMVDLPGRTQVATWANGALFLFTEEMLHIVDVDNPADPRLVRSLHVLPPAGATAWGNALYLVDDGSVQVLDVADAANPKPGVRLLPPAGMRFTLPGSARNGRLALQLRRATGAGSLAPFVAIYDLAVPQQPRLVAALPGEYTDAFFDGARLVMPGMRVVAIGPGVQWTAPLPQAPAAPFAFTPTGDLPNGVEITYSLTPSGTVAPTPTGATAPVRICLQHESDPTRPWSAAMGQSTYAGPFTLRTIDCATGASAVLNSQITMAVTVPTVDQPPYLWTQSALYADAGTTFAPLAHAQVTEGVWNATVQPPILWGVRGPLPDPVLLPVVAR